MEELRELSRKLLSEGAVKAVLGWEQGPHGVRPTFVTKAEDATRLVFDHRCVHNLAAYLSPRRSPVKALGKLAVVVKPCDGRAVAGLLRESQLGRENVVLIGMRCGGVVADPEGDAQLGPDTVAPRCVECESREPALADHVLGQPQPEPPRGRTRAARIAEIDAMSPDERLAYWAGVLERCTRCYACRQVCPLCFCERCVADKSQPQWIETSPHVQGNLVWHLTRALHLAGRCVDCGECERACHAGIPLNLLSRKVAGVMAERYGYRASDDPAAAAPIGTFRLDDGQEFIL
jgi:formate dehydrogenase (coenzyme F420) beta subunit